MTQTLKPCPCGKTPTKLVIQDGSTYRWRLIAGDCCGQWMIESGRIALGSSDKQVELECIESWNKAMRDGMKNEHN